MKKLMVALVMMVGLTSFAQQTVQKGRDILTAEQRTELQEKKLTLDLDLNESQQKQLSELILQQQKDMEVARAKRSETKSDTKPTADQRFEKRKEVLDRKIAYKQQVQKILTPHQFEKWEQKQDQRQARYQKHGRMKRKLKSKEISK